MKVLKNTISLIALLGFAFSVPQVNAEIRPVARDTKIISVNPSPNYQQLIKSLINQNQPGKALEIVERSQSRGLVNSLSTKISIESNQQSSIVEQIKQVAKTQNATLVQYSILSEEVTVTGKKQTQESELLIWVIKPSGEIAMRRVSLQGREEKFSLTNLIQQSRRRLGVKNKGIQVSPTQKDATAKSELQELHKILIQPIADVLPQKPEERVIFIPQDDLFLVSFAALQDANNKYLIEKHTISTAPAIQVVDLLHKRSIKNLNSHSNKNVLIAGNPTAPSVPLKPGGETCKLSPLPGTELEAKNIAQIFKTQALIGNAATETAIIQQMPQAKIIHLATNVSSSFGCQETGYPSAIALATSSQDNGWLTSEEIQKLHLKADLVVVSSCQTALGEITGDGVIGFSRAFLAAGANSFIGSMWDVDDNATAFLMTKFYENLNQNIDKSNSLRLAMLETMKQYPNPMQWAAFTLIGLP